MLEKVYLKYKMDKRMKKLHAKKIDIENLLADIAGTIIVISIIALIIIKLDGMRWE